MTDYFQLMRRFSRLTNRERDVCELLVEGKTNSEIALALGTARSTVKNQVTSIFHKLDKTNRSEVVIAYRQATRAADTERKS